MRSKKKIICGELCVSGDDDAASDILPCNHHIIDSSPIIYLYFNCPCRLITMILAACQRLDDPLDREIPISNVKGNNRQQETQI